MTLARYWRCLLGMHEWRPVTRLGLLVRCTRCKTIRARPVDRP